MSGILDERARLCPMAPLGIGLRSSCQMEIAMKRFAVVALCIALGGCFEQDRAKGQQDHFQVVSAPYGTQGTPGAWIINTQTGDLWYSTGVNGPPRLIYVGRATMPPPAPN